MAGQSDEEETAHLLSAEYHAKCWGPEARAVCGFEAHIPQPQLTWTAGGGEWGGGRAPWKVKGAGGLWGLTEELALRLG